MATKFSQVLINHCTAARFGELQLYDVINGEIPRNYGRGTAYPFRTKPTPELRYTCSFAPSHIATFLLHADGHATLQQYTYPLHPGRPAEILMEDMHGDFWFVMKPDDRGARTFVPFKAGILVADRSQWIRKNTLLEDYMEYRERNGLPPIDLAART